ncbi:hypothetical protein O9H85_25280 [Paenibacillus filicis]|uniref:Uncharacterized protein n=1 Tax=Paenibacillus gyeongsangnamensis TaxID=3388067 RepID=A0ABT4QFM4_9BACL|nr:hypothetical protein [Paenibacillus filicis]MCZ8515663.1 hypothetical protein [Paenibacillus filicis]
MRRMVKYFLAVTTLTVTVIGSSNSAFAAVNSNADFMGNFATTITHEDLPNSPGFYVSGDAQRLQPLGGTVSSLAQLPH